MTTYTQKHPSYREVLEYARRLSVRDQRRLREELARQSGVKLVSPSKSADAVRNGRKLADDVRKELQSTRSKSLNQTMRKLRGRAWS
jgi:hypothetical protein